MVNSFKGALTELLARRYACKGGLKGADLHILDMNEQRGVVAGVVEVKSGHKSAEALAAQIDKHIRRARQGLIVGYDEYAP